MVSEPCTELSRMDGWCSIPKGAKGAVGPCEASRALKDLAAVLLLNVNHVKCVVSHAMKRSNTLQRCHIRSVLYIHASCDLNGAYDLPCVKMVIQV